MLFRKKIKKACVYCLNGTELEDGQILCAKKGLRAPDAHCRKFRYDPCKRIPPRAKALDLSRFEQEDFSL